MNLNTPEQPLWGGEDFFTTQQPAADTIPGIQGRFVEKCRLSNLTWLQVGGETPLMFHPDSPSDLSHFLKLCSAVEKLLVAFFSATEEGGQQNPYMWRSAHHDLSQATISKAVAYILRHHATILSPLEHNDFFGGVDEKPRHHRYGVFIRSLCYGAPLILGAGSNLLVRDPGTPRMVIKMGKGFHDVHQDENCVSIGAGLFNRYVAQTMQTLGLSGLEFIFTIPGTIGGGLNMNAGCFDGEFSKQLISACVMDPTGVIHRVMKEDIGYGYRCHSLPPNWIFLSGTFQLTPQDPQVISARMESMVQKRNDTQPTHVKTGGSTFANPPGHSAWSLIDKAGFRGAQLGMAEFSNKHCNFLINQGGATAWQLETLAERARSQVYKNSGIWLKWEIVRWGVD